jgi:Nuclear transport factor 2 (NTF2) domain
MMTFEGNQLGGQQPIMNKLQSIGQVQHSIKSMDVQPSTTESALVIFVTGSIKIGGDNPLHFCEMFQLVAYAPGQYYIHNDVFRLNYGL